MALAQSIMASVLVPLLHLLLVSLGSASHNFGGLATYSYKGRNADGSFRVSRIFSRYPLRHGCHRHLLFLVLLLLSDKPWTSCLSQEVECSHHRWKCEPRTPLTAVHTPIIGAVILASAAIYSTHRQEPSTAASTPHYTPVSGARQKASPP